MTQPEDRPAPPEDNTANLGASAEENWEVRGIEKPESRETSPGHQTAIVKNENDANPNDANPRKRKLDIEEDKMDEKSRKQKLDIREDESEVRDSNRGPLIAQRSFIPRGIKNVGETCFINVALQCLLAMDNIRERYVKPLDQVSDSNFITYQICNFLAQRCSTMGSPDFQLTLPDPSEAPTELQNKLYHGLEKNHSGQTILKIVNLLDKENEGLEVQEGSETRPLLEDFMISFQTKVTCSSCGLDFSHPLKKEGMLPLNLTNDEVCRLRQLSGKWLQKLGDDRSKWLKLESLLPFLGLQNRNDTLSKCCDKCKLDISIEKAPRVLVVSWHAEVRQNRGELDHLSNKIEFEKYLDLSKFASKSPNMTPDDYKYRLIAVADFQGPVEIDPANPVVVGHTSAFILGSKYDQDKWIQFNDDVVTMGIEESHVLNTTHWVSVYERENIEIDTIKLPRDNKEIHLNKLPDDDETRRIEIDTIHLPRDNIEIDLSKLPHDDETRRIEIDTIHLRRDNIEIDLNNLPHDDETRREKDDESSSSLKKWKEGR